MIIRIRRIIVGQDFVKRQHRPLTSAMLEVSNGAGRYFLNRDLHQLSTIIINSSATTTHCEELDMSTSIVLY